jgi:uncharacterized membrane protein YczE
VRSIPELIRRYIFFAIGLFVNSLGVALIICAGLGISPAAIIPYVLSCCGSLSVGTYTIIVNLILLLLQIIILGKKFPKYQLLQIPVSIAFGSFVDICLVFCRHIALPGYGSRFLLLILGCVIRAFGVSMQVLADVVMLSGEALVKAISDKYEKNFSNVKLLVDAALVAVAAAISFAVTQKIYGVREGTIIAVLLIAPCSRFFTSRLLFVEKLLSGAVSVEAANGVLPGKNIIITLSSDYGSGGHKIGKIISEELGFKLYDRNLAGMVSRECGLGLAYTVSHDEKLYKNRLQEIYTEVYSVPGGSMDPFARLFEAQKKVITSISNENCVIIGHCANYILKNYPNAIHIHIHSDMKHRLGRLTRDYKLSPDAALKLISKREKSMSDYYRHFTGENWKDFDNYNITIDSGLLETSETANLLLDIIKRMQSRMTE